MWHVPSRPPPPPLVHFPTVVCLQNELGILEFIHALVETLDKYFENVVRAKPEALVALRSLSPYPTPDAGAHAWMCGLLPTIRNPTTTTLRW